MGAGLKYDRSISLIAHSAKACEYTWYETGSHIHSHYTDQLGLHLMLSTIDQTLKYKTATKKQPDWCQRPVKGYFLFCKISESP